MLHEIAPHVFNNRFQPSEILGEEGYIFHFKEDTLLLKKTADGVAFACQKDIPGIRATPAHRFLCTLDGIPCYLFFDIPATKDPSLVYQPVNFFRTCRNREVAWISLVAYQLMNWYTQNRFCGTCGSATREKDDERALVCSHCSHTVYPKISPAVIVAVTCRDKILLAQNVNFRLKWHSLIAGYVDIGESLEETVMREVKEETGVDVRTIRYFKSQPWPFSGSMMIGFFAEGDCNQEIRIDTREISHAAWYSRGNLPDHPPNISIAGEMIEVFENGGS